jgi:hypothetical protein
MENVTYYIGAGASINALPVYCNFSERLNIFKDFIYYYQKEKKDDNFKRMASHYIGALDKLIESLSSSNNPTLDILAHGLYQKNNANLGIDFYSVKYLVSDYFVFEQLLKKNKMYQTQYDDDEIIGWPKPYSKELADRVNTNIDPRYKSFMLPHLVGNNGQLKKLENRIKVISWNYDLQFELCYATNIGCSIDLAQQNLQVYPSPNTQSGIDLNQSAIIKLNGSAGVYYMDNNRTKLGNFIYERSLEMDSNYLDSMIETFHRNRSRIFDGLPCFKYYFEENNDFHKRAIDYAKDIISETTTLVVIGYTFHPSNRQIDAAVLNESKKIKKIILQVLPSDYDAVKYNLSRIIPDLDAKICSYPSIIDFAPLNNI